MKGTRCDRQVPFKICSFTRGWNETDNNSDEATPVPIPNTAVKLVRVDGIGAQFGAERVDRCRSHPSLLLSRFETPLMRGFLFYIFENFIGCACICFGELGARGSIWRALFYKCARRNGTGKTTTLQDDGLRG